MTKKKPPNAKLSRNRPEKGRYDSRAMRVLKWLHYELPTVC